MSLQQNATDGIASGSNVSENLAAKVKRLEADNARLEMLLQSRSVDSTNNSTARVAAQPKAAPKKAKKEPPPPTQTAKVEGLAEHRAGRTSATPRQAAVMKRIRKCLNRANHPSTGENETKAALRLSTRLMTQYNVTRADVMDQATTSEEQAAFSGQSTVAIRKTDKESDAKVIMRCWVDGVVHAITVFFNCKAYSSQRPRVVRWSFHGIAQNTVAAASAFAMVHNLILEWARWRKGKNDYLRGAAKGLWRMANEEKRREELWAKDGEQAEIEQRVEEERLQRQRELDRLVGPNDDNACSSPSPTSGSEPEDTDTDEVGSVGSEPGLTDDMEFDDFESDIEPDIVELDDTPLDLDVDFDEQLRRIMEQSDGTTIKREDHDADGDASERNIKTEDDYGENDWNERTIQTENKDERQSDGNEELLHWTSSKQLALFRIRADQIADDWLVSDGKKLNRKRKYKDHTVQNRDAYKAGKRDSEKIDVKGRKLE